jgi:hypothetical protein
VAPELQRLSAVGWRAHVAVAIMGLLGASALQSSAASAQASAACSAVDVDYAITTALQLRDTRLGAADGVYPSGTGTLRLRIDGRPEAGSREVQLVSFDTRGRFEIAAHALLWTTRVITDAHNTIHPDPPGALAHGTLDGTVLRWASPMSGYRSDGTLTCDGTMCGSFGAPGAGTTPLHDGPHQVLLNPFVFARDRQTFTMPFALVSRTPAQTSYLAVSGREIARRCASLD